MKPNLLTSIIAVLIGVIVGVGSYTFIYAKGYSYFSSNAAACTNCHVMRGVYDSWVKGSHHAAAKCNDCHTPDNAVAKLAIKTENGFFHSAAFTLGNFPDAIHIKQRSTNVAEANCRRCHLQMLQAVNGPHAGGTGISCIHCHASAGHDTSVAFAPISLAERNK